MRDCSGEWGGGDVQNAGNFLEHPELLKFKFFRVGGAM